MNQSFLRLPIEKVDNILNAGYKTFAAHSLKKENELILIDRAKFRNPGDVDLLYDIIITYSEGYMAKHLEDIFTHPEQLLQDNAEIFATLKRNFYREEFL